MRERANITTEDEVVQFISHEQVVQICEEHGTDKEPSEVIDQLRRYDKDRLLAISNSQEGMQGFVKTVLFARDAIKENCNN